MTQLTRDQVDKLVSESTSLCAKGKEDVRKILYAQNGIVEFVRGCGRTLTNAKVGDVFVHRTNDLRDKFQYIYLGDNRALQLNHKKYENLYPNINNAAKVMITADFINIGQIYADHVDIGFATEIKDATGK